MPSIWTTWRERRAAKQDPGDKERQRRRDYAEVFATPAGQRVLADLLHRCGVAQTSFHAGQPDLTAFLEGRRRIGWEIIETINADPDAIFQLVQGGQTESLYP